METTYSREIPATPEYILSVFQAEHRQLINFDPDCDPEIELSFESTILDWRIAQDLLPPRKLAPAINKAYGLSIPIEQWLEVLTPERTRTLRGVCELIAAHTKRTEIKPLSIAGTYCLPAGAFLAIKDCLAQEEVDVSDIAPSTPLREYARNYWPLFLLKVDRLNPGSLPEIEIVPNQYQRDSETVHLWVLILMLVGGLLSLFTQISAIFILFALLLWLMNALSEHTSRTFKAEPPESVTFGELKTFRDLAVCVADGCITGD